MVDSDLKKYTDLYLENARLEIETLRGLLSGSKDLVELHRISHTLKGQSYFMKFNEIGDKAKSLELLFKKLLDQGQTILEENDFSKNALNEIENLLNSVKI